MWHCPSPRLLSGKSTVVVTLKMTTAGAWGAAGGGLAAAALPTHWPNSSTAANEGVTAVGTLNNNDYAYDNFTPGITNLGVGNGEGAYNQILLAYTYVGDADLNGTVTFDDLNVWQSGYSNGFTGWENADFNYDGVVNFDDLNTWQSGYSNQGAPLVLGSYASFAGVGTGGGSGALPVPEPGTTGLLMAGATLGIGMMKRRFRRLLS